MEAGVEAQLESLRTAWVAAPHDAEAGYQYGLALYEAGAFDDARRVLAESGRVTREPEVLIAVGRALEALAAWDDALEAYRHAAELDPLSANAHGYGAAIEIRLHGVESAQPRLRRWASLSEHPTEAHFGLASMFVAEDALGLAADHLQIALDLDPTHIAAQELLGIVLGREGDREGSVAAWRAARALAPESPQTASGLGAALSLAGEHEEAVPLLEIGVLGPTERCRLGVSLRETGAVDRALEVLAEATQATAHSYEAHAELGQTRLELGQVEPAVEALQRAAQLAPRVGEVHHQLGRALVAANRQAQALAAHLKAAALLPEDPAVQVDLLRLQDELRGVSTEDEESEASVAEMSGQLDVVTLPNLLEFFTANNSSGLLSITSGRRQAQVFLDSGRIAAAQSQSGPRLGDVLVESGDITRDQLEGALSAPSTQTVAKAVLDRGLVPEDTLSRRMDAQIVEVLMRVVTWPKGAFRFQQGEGLTAKAYCAHAMDTRFALMEVMRRLDEARAGQ